jgi:DNA-binding transcriptional MerR regulator
MTKTFSLDDLCTLTDLPKRTVRYYMQMGLVDRPIGETRAAHYLTAHLDQLLKVKQLTDAGISLERIAEIQNGEELPVPAKPRKPGDIQVRSHVHVAPGIELQISPEEADMSPEQIRALVKAVMKTIQEIKA